MDGYQKNIKDSLNVITPYYKSVRFTGCEHVCHCSSPNDGAINQITMFIICGHIYIYIQTVIRLIHLGHTILMFCGLANKNYPNIWSLPYYDILLLGIKTVPANQPFILDFSPCFINKSTHHARFLSILVLYERNGARGKVTENGKK